MIEKIKTFFNTEKAQLEGEKIIKSQTTLGKLKGIFADQVTYDKLDKETIVYSVEMHNNGLKEGEAGGLFFGISHIYSGMVGDEFYMTRGHVHQKLNTGEYYWGISGKGILLLTLGNSSTKIEKVEPGSLHYIPGKAAHRLINTGKETLSVGACWFTESGHNYGNGSPLFHKRVIEEKGKIKIIDA